MAALVPLPQTPLPLDVLCMVPDRPDLPQAEGGVEKNEDRQHQDRDTDQDMCHHQAWAVYQSDNLIYL